MTAADARRSTATAARRYRYHRCYDVLTVAVAVWAAAAASATAARFAVTTDATVGKPLVMTFEGGETATAPADDTVYLTEEVATLNATARDAGDYAYYDDYGAATDRADAPAAAVLVRGPSHQLSKPAKHGKTNGTVAAGVPADATSTATVTAVADATSTATVTAAAPVSSTAARAPAEVTATDADHANRTTAAPATVTETATESGTVMQMAVPPGFGAATTATAPATAATTPMTPSSSGTAPRRSATLLLFVAVTTAAAATTFA